MTRYSASKRLGGFTLIELLVVIAIIAILAAMLIAIFASARRKAKYVLCSTNTSQLTRAILLYAGDNEGVGPPHVGWGGDCWNSDVTQSPIWKYLKSGVSSGEVTRCPNDSDDLSGKRRRWSITLNAFLVADWFWMASTGVPGNGYEGMPYDMFSQPARLPTWVCENTDPRLGEVVNDTNFANEDITSARHDGSCAVSYLDGHSGILKGRLKWNTAKWPDGVYIFRQTNGIR